MISYLLQYLQNKFYIVISLFPTFREILWNSRTIIDDNKTNHISTYSLNRTRNFTPKSKLVAAKYIPSRIVCICLIDLRLARGLTLWWALEYNTKTTWYHFIRNCCDLFVWLLKRFWSLQQHRIVLSIPYTCIQHKCSGWKVLHTPHTIRVYIAKQMSYRVVWSFSCTRNPSYHFQYFGMAFNVDSVECLFWLRAFNAFSASVVFEAFIGYGCCDMKFDVG